MPKTPQLLGHLQNGDIFAWMLGTTHPERQPRTAKLSMWRLHQLVIGVLGNKGWVCGVPRSTVRAATTSCCRCKWPSRERSEPDSGLHWVRRGVRPAALFSRTHLPYNSLGSIVSSGAVFSLKLRRGSATWTSQSFATRKDVSSASSSLEMPFARIYSILIALDLRRKWK